MPPLRRRDFLAALGGAAALRALGGCDAPPASGSRGAAAPPSWDASCAFATRGVVLVPSDLSLGDWPERAAAAGLSTIALHGRFPRTDLVPFVESDDGRRFLDRCAQLGLDVEFEVHAMNAQKTGPAKARPPLSIASKLTSRRTRRCALFVSSPRYAVAEGRARTAHQLFRASRPVARVRLAATSRKSRLAKVLPR